MGREATDSERSGSLTESTGDSCLADLSRCIKKCQTTDMFVERARLQTDAGIVGGAVRNFEVLYTR